MIKNIVVLAFFGSLICFCSISNNDYSIVYDNSQCEDLDLKREILEIEKLPYLPELSGSKKYWELVKNNKKLFCMVNLIKDTTETNIVIPNSGGNYLVADVSINLLSDIILCLPVEEIVCSHFPNYCIDEKNVFEFLHEDYQRYGLVYNGIDDWINKNIKELVWVVDDNNYRKSNSWEYEGLTHPALGYFKLFGESNCEFAK